jgi:hypothetical protein
MHMLDVKKEEGVRAQDSKAEDRVDVAGFANRASPASKHVQVHALNSLSINRLRVNQIGRPQVQRKGRAPCDEYPASGVTVSTNLRSRCILVAHGNVKIGRGERI